MSQKLLEVWIALKIEWRRRLAIMKTRGFWTVNMVWFVAGIYFSWLLPPRDPDIDQVTFILNQILIAVIALPIYWTELPNLSAYFNRQIDRYHDWRNRNRTENHES